MIKTLHVEFTTACNSRCITCDYWKNGNPDIINVEFLLKSVDELTKQGLQTLYVSGGESLVCAQELFNAMSKIKERFPHLKTGIMTNGLLLMKYYREIAEYFKKVIVSLDSLDKEKYKKIRGVDGVDIICGGIERLREYSPETEINLRVLVLDDNVDELLRISEYGISHSLNKISFIPENVSYKDAFGRNGKNEINKHNSQKTLGALSRVIYEIRNRYSNKIGTFFRQDLKDLEYIVSLYSGEKILPECDKSVYSCVIDADGRVNPCFFIKGKNIASDALTLREILNGKDYKETLKSIAEGREKMCEGCPCPKILS